MNQERDYLIGERIGLLVGSAQPEPWVIELATKEADQTMRTHEKLILYRDALRKWREWQKNNPKSTTNPEPKPEDYHLKSITEKFVAKSIQEEAQ